MFVRQRHGSGIEIVVFELQETRDVTHIVQPFQVKAKQDVVKSHTTTIERARDIPCIELQWDWLPNTLNQKSF